MPNFTDAELRLLSLLTWKTRVAADVQLAGVLGVADSERSAFVRRLKQLARRGFLTRHLVAVALLVPEAPLVNWLPDLPEPDWQSVAWRLQSRWTSLSASRTWINAATRRAAAMVGGVGGRLRQPMQLQHDLAVTAVYLVRQADCPPNESWLGEDAYRLFLHPRARVKIPDALIVDPQYQTRRVIELGGLYSPRRLKGFHRHWASRRIPYEIW
jgi:hypothetical protein